MNYTEEVKEEILNNIASETRDKVVFLTSITKMAASFDLHKNRKYSLIYEFKEYNVASKVCEIIKDLYSIELELGLTTTEPKNYTITISGENANAMLKDMHLSHFENGEYVFDDNLKYIASIHNRVKVQSYMQGIFCVSGSVYFPEGIESERGYHFELVFTDENYALGIKSMLEKCNVNLAYVDRENSYALYTKSSEGVSDMLAMLKAMDAAIKVNEVSVQREVNNKLNRESNILAANMDKTMAANTKYIQAIELIDEKVGINTLDEKMQKVCRARLEDKQSSMSALSEKLNMTKSSLNRVLKKIIDKASELEEKK